MMHLEFVPFEVKHYANYSVLFENYCLNFDPQLAPLVHFSCLRPNFSHKATDSHPRFVVSTLTGVMA